MTSFENSEWKDKIRVKFTGKRQRIVLNGHVFERDTVMELDPTEIPIEFIKNSPDFEIITKSDKKKKKSKSSEVND